MESLRQALYRHRIERPRQIALADDIRELSYDSLPDAIDDCGQRLLEHDVKVLALELDNGFEWILWDIAAACVGVVCVPIAPFFSPDQRTHVHVAAGVDAVISPRGLEQVENGAPRLPHGTAKISFTSGTTGTPKGVCLPWDGLQQVAQSVFEQVGSVAYGRHFSAMPLAVLLENVAGVYAALLAGCRIALPGCADTWMNPAVLLRSLAASRANTVILVPELLRGLIAAMARSGQSLPDLEFVAVGGSRVAPALIRQARALGLPVYEGYGLSECGSVVALSTPAHDRPGSVGRVLPHVELGIEDGEITIANPVSLGYLGGESHGLLRSGDLGALDGNGFLSVHGRSKNVLITSYGRNISPEWLEAALLSQPQILQSLVCGDGWPRPGALIVAGDDDDATIDNAVAAANAALPEYARIAGWIRVPPFTPDNGLVTGTGRPRRDRIVERHLETLESHMNQSSFCDHLVDATRQARDELYSVPQLVDGLNGRISLGTYIAYLTEAYHHVSHTVPLLMAMGSRLPRAKQWLQPPIIEYINEEKGHEQWILNDIDAAGGNADNARDATPNLATEVLVAYNYDYIQRNNPVGFLGMVFMLESTSTQIATRGAASIQSSLGLPDTALSYLVSHGSLDQEHMKFYRELVNRITDKADQEAIIQVARNTFRLFADVLRSIPHHQEIKDAA